MAYPSWTMGSDASPDRGELIEKLYASLSIAARGKRFRNRWCAPSSLAQETICRMLRLSELPASEDQLRAVGLRYMEWTLLDRIRSEIARRLREEHARHPGTMNHEPADPSTDQVRKGLAELAKMSPRKAEVVALWARGDMSAERIAQVLGVSARTVSRDIEFACAWLATQVEPQPQR
jgi:DNA-directed RNA polymerase specialized sigma24 family protein